MVLFLHVDPAFTHSVLHLQCMTGPPVCPNHSSIRALTHGVSPLPLYLLRLCVFFEVYFQRALLHETVSDHPLDVSFLSLQNADSLALRAFSSTLCDLVI